MNDTPKPTTSHAQRAAEIADLIQKGRALGGSDKFGPWLVELLEHEFARLYNDGARTKSE